MKRIVLALCVITAFVACDSPSAEPAAEPATDQTPSDTPEAAPVLEGRAFNAGVFVTEAEDILKADNSEYMNVYLMQKPAGSTVDQPGMEAELKSWRFVMSANEAGRQVYLTLATLADESSATALMEQVPSFSYLRSNLAKDKQHRTARFGHQCVHLAADCGISSEQFEGIWNQVTNALDNPVYNSSHNQPCVATDA